MTATTIATAETECRDFSAQFPTPNVLAAIAYCETGRLGWSEVRDLFARSLGTALKTEAR